MDRAMELSERIKAKAQERKEREKCAKYTDVKLEGTNALQAGFTKSGKRVVFESCMGFSSQSMYGAGTFSVYDGNERKVIFTKGYPSKALEYMMNN